MVITTLSARGGARSKTGPGVADNGRVAQDGAATKSTPRWLRQLHDSHRGGPLTDLEHLDADAVRVSQRAAQRFTARHGGSRIDALDGLRDTLEDLIDEGHSERDHRGYLCLWSDGYRLLLSPDLGTIVDYQTVHRQRTLSEVRDGVPSQSRGPALPTRQLADVVTSDDVDRIIIPAGLLRPFATPLGATFAELRLAVRDAIDAALESGQVTPVTRGKQRAHELVADGWRVVLRADARRAVELERVAATTRLAPDA